MIKTLAGSIRQYKKQTIMSPVTVALEVFFYDNNTNKNAKN